MTTVRISRAAPGQRSTTPPGGHGKAGGSPLIPDFKFPPPEAGTLATATDINSTVSEPSHEPVAGEGSTVPVVYGGALVKAKIIAAQFNGPDLLLSCAWCHGEIEAFFKVQVNDADPPTSLVSTWTVNNFRGQQAGLSVTITGSNTFTAASGTPFSDFVPYKTIVQFQGFANAANNAAVNVVSVGGGGASFTTGSATLVNEGPRTVDLIDWNLRSSLGAKYADVNAGVAYSVVRVSPGSVSGFPRPTAYVWGTRVPNVQLAYVALSGSGQYGTTPDSSQNRVDEDFEIAALLAADDWTPAADAALLAKWDTTGDQRAYRLLLKAGGALALQISTDGAAGTVKTYTSAAAVGAADRSRKWVRVRYRRDDGANSVASFATSDDGSYWTALGADQTGTQTATIFGASAALRFGADGNGSYLAGRLWAARMQTSSKLVCDVKVLEAGPSVSAWTDWAGVPWTLAGSVTTNAYVAYSKVPINCLVDFATNAVYGAGKRADIGTALRVYDLNTMQVGTGTTEDYNQIDLVIDSPALTEDWINVLRDYANCAAVLEGDTYYFPRDWKDSSVYSFDSTNIVQGTMQIVKRSGIQQPNVVEVSYTNISKVPWFTDRAIVYRSGVLDGTLPRRASQVNKLGLTRYSEAIRYATGRLNDATVNDLSISFVVADEGAYVREGDVIDVSYPYLKNDPDYTNTFNAKEFRVVRAEMQAPGIWGIAAVEKNDERYDDSVVQQSPANDTSLPRSDAPPAPAAYSDGFPRCDVYQAATGLWASRVEAEWPAVGYPFADAYIVEVYDDAEVLRDSGSVPASLSPRWLSKQLPEFVEGTDTLISYSVRLRVRSYTGAIGPPLAASVKLSGKSGIPGDIGRLEGFELGGEVRLTWTATRADGTPIDLDWTATELRYGLTTETWDDCADRVLNRVAAPGVFYSTKVVPDSGGNADRVWRFFAKALDSVRTKDHPFGQYSANAAHCDFEVTTDAGAFVAVDYDYGAPLLAKMKAATFGSATSWVSSSGASWGSVLTSNVGTYGSALASYFAPAASAFVSEIKDHGAAITGSWSATLPYADLSGAAQTYLDLSATGPESPKTISGATNATPIVMTVTGHGYSDGDEVEQAGMTGNTAANGRFVIALDGGDPTNKYALYDLAGNAVAGNGAYAATSPTARRWAWYSYSGMRANTAAQWSRVRLKTTGVAQVTGGGHVRVSVVARHEGGTVTCTAGSDYVVSFAGVYNAAVVTTATVLDEGGGVTGDTARCDMVEVSGGHGLCSGYVLRFTTAGAPNQYVAVGDYADYEFTTGSADKPFTVEFWLKPKTVGLMGVVAKGYLDTATGSYEVRVTAAGKVRFAVIDSTASAYVSAVGSTKLVADKWHHVACVLVPGGGSPELRVYLNGAQEAATYYNFGSYVRMRDTAQALEFGRNANGAYLDGRLDEVRIWDSARSSQEIADNMGRTSGFSGSGTLVGRWSFDEGSGTAAADTGSGGHNGTLSGSPAPLHRPYDGMNVSRLNGTSRVAGKVSWSFDGV